MEDNEKYRLFAVRAEEIPADAEYFFLLPEMALLYTREEPEMYLILSYSVFNEHRGFRLL